MTSSEREREVQILEAHDDSFFLPFFKSFIEV